MRLVAALRSTIHLAASGAMSPIQSCARAKTPLDDTHRAQLDECELEAVSTAVTTLPLRHASTPEDGLMRALLQTDELPVV